jgi:hypothetical protein
MPLTNGIFWARQIRQVFLPDIDALAKCLTDRLLPTFGNLGEEAEQLEQEMMVRMDYSEHTDPAALVDQARDEAITFFQRMESIQQGLINMFAVGLWHTLEQKLLLMHRRELLAPNEEGNSALWSLDEIKKRLEAAGIDIETFPSWLCVDELRLLSNTVKHAEGYSCAELKVRNPDLFVPPADPGDVTPLDWLRDAYIKRPVYETILGESLYVSREQYSKYVEAVHAFLINLADWLERVPLPV